MHRIRRGILRAHSALSTEERARRYASGRFAEMSDAQAGLQFTIAMSAARRRPLLPLSKTLRTPLRVMQTRWPTRRASGTKLDLLGSALKKSMMR